MPSQFPDLTQLSPQTRAAFLALGERVRSLEIATKSTNERLDAAGLPSAHAMLRPTPIRPAPANPHAPTPPVLPTQISVPASVPTRIAQAIRMHSAIDANQRNTQGEIRVSATRYAQATANRLAGMWNDPGQRAAAETELADSLAAAEPDATEEILDAAFARSPLPGHQAPATLIAAQDDEGDDEFLDRVFGA